MLAKVLFADGALGKGGFAKKTGERVDSTHRSTFSGAVKRRLEEDGDYRFLEDEDDY